MPPALKMKNQIKNSTKIISQWLDYQMYIREIPGISVGIIHDSEIAYQNAFGYADIQEKKKTSVATCYHIASISKTFTATAIMQLVEQEELQLDDRVSKYLTWFSSKKDKNIQEITVRQLLSHSSGLYRDGNTAHWETDDFPKLQQIKDFISDEEATAYAPLERFKYSNIGYAILGEIIAEISGLSYKKYIEKHIIQKIGLKHTSIEVNSRNKKLMAVGYEMKLPGKKQRPISTINTHALAPASGIVSNISDICEYMTAQVLHSDKLLSKKSKREMQRIQWFRGDGEDVHYGLGYEILKTGGNQYFGHNGGFSGYSTAIRMDNLKKIGVSVLTNTIGGQAGTLVGGVYSVLRYFMEKEVGIQEIKKQENAQKFEGHFTSRWGDLVVIEVDGRLLTFFPHMADPIAGLSSLEPLGKNTFRICGDDDFDSMGETMRYEFDNQENINQVFWGSTPMKIVKK